MDRDVYKREFNFYHAMIPGFTSVIIPVYRDVEGLKDTLVSLDKQEMPKEDYEIIVVNDGADGSITKLCIEYRTKMVAINPNMGSYFARNKAIEICRGEYLAFTDANVKVSPDWLLTGKALMAEADYVAGAIYIDRSKVKTLSHYYELHTAFPVKRCFEEEHFGPTANLFVKRKVFEEIGGFDERMRFGGDNEFGSRVFHYKKYVKKQCDRMYVLHPPRSYLEIVEKRRRGMQAMLVRSKLYPERFPQKTLASELFKSLLPCRIETVSLVVDKKPAHWFVYYFFFCWSVKILSGFSMLYKTILFAVNTKKALPSIRVEVHDFS